MRKDHQIIKAIYNLYGAEATEDYVKLPFFEISPESEERMIKGEEDSGIGHAYIPNWNDPDEIMGLLPFPSFNVWIPEVGLYSIYIFEHDEVTESYNIVVSNYVDERAAAAGEVPVGSQIVSRFNVKPHYDTKTMKHGVLLGLVNFVINGKDQMSKLDEKDQNHYVKSVYRNVEFALGYFKYVESNDLYMIERKERTTSRDTKSRQKKPWTCKDYPTIIYLNVLPSERTSTESNGNGSHTPKKAHQRRGHWRKLDHPRFKKHPKFGKKIRIKPSWIGDKEAVVGNTIYRVKLGDNYE